MMTVERTSGLKAKALDFLRLAAAGHSRQAFFLYASESFRHHNPYFQGDAHTLMTAMEEAASENPNKILQVKHALEDGDLVAVHSHIRQHPNDLGGAVIHIFRFEHDKIVELWDFGQDVPDDMVNENGMF